MWTVVALLLILWLGALLASYTFGGLIHLVPLLAIAFVILTLWSRRKRKYARY